MAAAWSQTWTFFDGEWHEGNVPLWGARTHAIWLGSSVFDGARVFEGVAPDLDLHCARVNASAKTMYLKPGLAVEEWMGLAREGMKKFDQGHDALCAADVLGRARRPAWRCRPIPNSTRFALTLYDAPMRKPDGFSITLSPFRRPTVGDRAGRRQGRLPLSEQRARHVRGEIARLRQLHRARRRRQRRRARQFQRVHGQGRRRVHADPERHVPRRHHAPARHRAAARRRRARWSRRCCAMPTSRPPTRSSRPATPPRCCRSPASASASLQPGPLYRKARELYWAFAHSSG